MISFKAKLLLVSVSSMFALSCATRTLDEGDKKLANPTGYLPKKQYYSSIYASTTKMAKASRLINSGHYADAQKVLNSLLKARKNVSGAYYLKGYICMLEKRYEMAKYLYGKLKGKESYQIGINNNLGVISLIEDDLDSAIYYFNKVLKEDPYYLPALMNRGRIALRYGLYEKAYEDMSRAYSSNDDDPDVLLLYGVALRGLRKYTEAKKILTKISGTREGLYNLGLLYYEDLKDWKNSKKIFEKYLRSGSSFGQGDMAETYLSRARGKLDK